MNASNIGGIEVSNMKPPRVSIGLPVCNGENFVAPAIDSILAQTFTDFELIISDNASTDRTAAICREYAAMDERIRYYRNDRNLGAAANFNRVFELASGEYFKWAAHDDMLAPEYLEKCVAALASYPEAVLCYPFVREIDERGETITVRESGFRRAGCHRASDRFASVLIDRSNWREIFGVARTGALRKTALHGNYEAEDIVLLAELALLGPFLQVPEPLFLHREHPDRFVNAVRRPHDHALLPFDPDRVSAWYQPHLAHERQVGHMWMRLTSLRDNVRRHVSETGERLRCYGHLLRLLVRGTRATPSAARLLLIETIAAIDPRPLVAARAAKRWLFGPGPILRRGR